MRRITPEEVVAAYKETGCKPAAFNFLITDSDGTPCGCALGVLALQAKEGPTTVDQFAAKIGLDALYANGFVWGFDDTLGIRRISRAHGEPYATGYADGQLVGQTVMESL